jgi:predicted nucleic acid-binding protein
LSRRLLDKLIALRAQIIVPTLLPIELAGAISRVRGDIALAADMASAMLALPTLRFIALDERLARTSAELAARNRLRGADEVYAAVALTYRCELVSLDHEHLTRLKTVVSTITPLEALAKI